MNSPTPSSNSLPSAHFDPDRWQVSTPVDFCDEASIGSAPGSVSEQSGYKSQLQDQILSPPPVQSVNTSFRDAREGTDPFAYHVASWTAQKKVQDIPKLPWETAPWAQVFTRSASSSSPSLRFTSVGFSDVMLQATMPTEAEILPAAPLPEFAKRRLKLCNLSRAEDEIRANCLAKFKTMLLLDPSQTGLGNSLLDAAGSLVDERLIQKSFVDCFSPKSTNTLLKRSNLLWNFCKWVLANKLGSPLQFREDVVYMYLDYLQSSGRGATTASSFLDSIAFLHGLAKIGTFQDGLVISGRCRGLARSQYARKRKKVQAPPLTTDMVWALERFTSNNCQNHLGVISGHMLLCIYSCARWADSMYLDSIEEFQQGRIILVETGTVRHKTQITDEAKSLVLPLLCLGQCLYSHPWSTSWLEARLVFKLYQSHIAMPTWIESASAFGRLPMSSSEATIWLREILVLCGFDSKAVEPYTSHSFKATLLSWSAKRATFTDAERRRMGHHVDPADKSMLLYSRDAYASLAVKIRLMLDDIIKKKFQPDLSRVARIAELLGEHACEPESCSEASSLNEDERNDLDPSTALQTAPRRRPVVPSDFGNLPIEHCLVHRLSGVVHATSDFLRLCCGRKVSSNYVEFETTCMDEESLCQQCRLALKEGS